MKNKSKSKHGLKEQKVPSIKLPEDYPWKVLGWLSQDLSQFLEVGDQVLIESIIRSRDISRLSGLSKMWGLQSMLTTAASFAEMRAKYQLTALLKKFRFPSDKLARQSAAKEKFLDGENSCYQFNLEGWADLAVGRETWEVHAFTYACAFLEKLFGLELPGPNVLTERSRHGPGATTSTTAGLVSSYFKFRDWPYDCTFAALRIARQAIQLDERWLGALEDDYRTRFGIPKHFILNRSRFWENVFRVVPGSRITFVPKSYEIDRTIAIEPTMNLYLQLGVDGYLRRRLKRWGVDLDDQTKNQELARLGSVRADDPFVTIDLANASNCISWRLCKLLLPEEWFSYLSALRSPQGRLEGEDIIFQMFSSMGNGYTFALESALFTAIIYGVMRAMGIKFDPAEFAVYGDDIIVRQSIAGKVIKMLANAGFRTNDDKSFLYGFARESCGTDWFLGTPVRPVFLQDTPSDIRELFSDINRLKRILDLRWGIEESKTELEMRKWVPSNMLGICGPYSDEEFDSYLHVGSPKFPYKNCLYKYRRIVFRPQEVAAPSYHFRKLMHDLHPSPQPAQKWDRLPGVGGRFTVIRRGSGTVSISHSVSSYWRSEYAEFTPKAT